MEQESWLESDENYAKWSSQNTTFLDEAYVNQAYTLAPNFNFAECKKDKGGDEKDEEEDLPSDEGEEPSEAEDNSSESDSSSSA